MDPEMLSTEQGYHVGASVSGSTVTLYKWGWPVPNGTQQFTGTRRTGALNMQVGRIEGAIGNYAKGGIDEVWVFNRALDGKSIRVAAYDFD